MRPRSLLADLGPGGAAGIAVLTVLAALRAAGLLLIAQGVAASIASLAAGHGPAGGELVLAVGGVLLRALAAWGTTVASARLAARAKRRWRARLAAHIGETGVAGRSEEALLATRGLDDLDGSIGIVLPTTVAALVIPVALGLRILSVDPLSALIVAVTVPLIPVFMVLIGLHSRERAERAAGALARLGDHLVELAEGLPVLVGLGRAGEQTEALGQIQGAYRRRLDRAVRTALLSALALELIATLSVAVVAVTLGIRLLSGSMTLDAALIVLLLAPDCFGALRDVGAAYHQAQDGREALRRVRALLERTRTALRRVPGAPALVDVRIRRPDGGGVGPISAVLPRTGVVRVAGASGAGKSTLLDALAGAGDDVAQLEGTVIGMPPEQLAVARQAPRFAAPTARAELRMQGGGDAVLGELGLDAVADLPIGQLSPGEQRRVAVARALARADAGARVLLLDEPTAHLDAAAAERVVGAVLDRARTRLVLVASHDPRFDDLARGRIDVGASTVPGGRGASSGPMPAGAADGLASEPPSTARTRSSAATWTGAALLGVVAAGMSLALTGVSGWLIVRAAAEPAIMYLLVAIVGVRFFGLGRAVARYAERIVSHRAALELVDRVRLRLWGRLADLGSAARGARDAGTALELLVTLPAQLRDLLPRVVTPLVAGTVAGLGTAVAVTMVAPAAWPVALLLVLATAVAPLGAWAADRRRQRAVVARNGTLTRRFAAFSSAAADLRANGVAGVMVDALSADARRLELAERRQAVVTATVATAAGLGTGAAALLAPLLVPRAELAAVVALLSLAMLEPIAAAAAGAQRLPALTAVVRRLRAGFEEGVRPPAPGTALPAARVARVELDDLTLAWGGSPVVEHVDAALDVPGWVAIHGPSGSGKTTMVTALLGDLAPASGAIRADGVDLATIERDAWRHRIAWCPQEGHVFDSTLRANLRIARPRTDPVTDDEARGVLEGVGLGHLIAGDAGLDLRVGPHGSRLSGGERQRLAVARTLLRRAELIVLDEPTAHLDEATADLVMDDIATATAGRLVVLVSHRAADRARAGTSIELGRRELAPR